jgi:hypothetical protein|tara:strand:+ start:461 stop:790 length:330 start_codon:yes stop_codon:yes gene_type:complete
MDYYNPADLTTEDLIKRVRIGNATQEFIRTPTGLAIAARAIDEYRNGIEAFQKMSMQDRVGSSEEELQQYREISNKLATPLQLLHWLDAIIADGENAESIAKYKDSGDI